MNVPKEVDPMEAMALYLFNRKVIRLDPLSLCFTGESILFPPEDEAMLGYLLYEKTCRLRLNFDTVAALPGTDTRLADMVRQATRSHCARWLDGVYFRQKKIRPDRLPLLRVSQCTRTVQFGGQAMLVCGVLSGNSDAIMEAILALEERSYQVRDVLALIDAENGTEKELNLYGKRCFSMIKQSRMLEVMLRNGYLRSSRLCLHGSLHCVA